MRIIESVSEMQRLADTWRKQGERITLVPTMGYLHQGHIELMRAAREIGSKVVISIFVNPAQFAPNEDFESYPRDTERDIRMATEVEVDVAFLPQTREIYPDGYQTYVNVTEVTRNLCGRSRPVFFRGVATVVAKLFHIVKPHAAVFGEKDFQQLITIKRMVKDLNLDITIVGHPTVREDDGLAMSSRNAYLKSEERPAALRLNRSLGKAQAMIDAGERDCEAILDTLKNYLASAGCAQIDYVQLCHPETLEDVARIEGATLLAMAVWVGKTRLIDNRMLQLPHGEE
jgi:pantoate--beta-alanine ligase